MQRGFVFVFGGGGGAQNLPCPGTGCSKARHRATSGSHRRSPCPSAPNSIQYRERPTLVTAPPKACADQHTPSSTAMKILQVTLPYAGDSFVFPFQLKATCLWCTWDPEAGRDGAKARARSRRQNDVEVGAYLEHAVDRVFACRSALGRDPFATGAVPYSEREVL